MEPHPIATAEQHEHELAALELIKHPTVVEAHARVKADWLAKADPSPDMAACYDWAFDEVMFSAAIWSSNQDPLRPKVICITRLGHPVGDAAVPGSRWGIDNPDSMYRVIPISGDERYLLHGKVAEKRMTENYFTLWDDSMNTVDVLSGHDLEVDADGNFTITVDSSPADGRSNHVQSAPEAHEFYIRDVMLDWATDTPNELRVERLGDPPTKPALTPDEQAELTATFMAHYADFTYSMSSGSLRSRPNKMSLAYSADTGGAMRNQVYIGGHFDLDDADALVIHVSDGGAGYFVVPIANVWGTTLDIVDHTSSLNKAQSVTNDDGTYTYVLSKNDPGVHNWLDTCGLGVGMLTLRMAEFPDGRPNDDLSARSEVIALDELRDRLPAGTTWLTPDDRSAQVEARAAAYRRRLPEVL